MYLVERWRAWRDPHSAGGANVFDIIRAAVDDEEGFDRGVEHEEEAMDSLRRVICR